MKRTMRKTKKPSTVKSMSKTKCKHCPKPSAYMRKFYRRSTGTMEEEHYCAAHWQSKVEASPEFKAAVSRHEASMIKRSTKAKTPKKTTRKAMRRKK